MLTQRASIQKINFSSNLDLFYVQRVTELGRRKFFEEKLVDKDKKLKINTVEEGMKKVREVIQEAKKKFKLLAITFFMSINA